MPTRFGIEQELKELPEGEPEYGKTALEIGRALTERLEMLTRSRQVTQNTLVQAGWAVLLSRYSGATDVLFGGTVAGRSAPVRGIESMVGLFINTLPVRVRLLQSERVSDYLNRLQMRQAEAREYEYSSLLKVQEWSDVPRGTALFEHIAVFENFPLDLETRERLSTSLRISQRETFDVNNFGLTFVTNPGEQLLFICSFSRRQFAQEDIDRILRQMAVLLEQMEESPQGRVDDLSLMTKSERLQILVEWNHTVIEYPGKCVHDLLEDQSVSSPEAIAVEHAGSRLSYAELNRRANQLGHYLQGLGAGPETMVGICVDRVPELLIGLLGILKAGATYVPLDPSYPADRLGYMLGDAQIPILLTQKHLEGSLPTSWVQVVKVDEDWPAIAMSPEGKVESGVTADNLAYVIYTSGSTGSPKGVAVTHLGLSNYVNWAIQTYRMQPETISPVHSSLSFDLTVTSLYPALLTGGRVLLLPQGQEMESLAKLLESGADVGVVKLTPSHLQMMNALMDHDRKSESAPTLVIGGESLKYADLQLWRFQGSRARLINEYGPTETVVGSVIYEVAQNGESRGDVPIGRPIANTQVYVLDGRLEAVPPGVAGELYIAGKGVVRGYLNRADLTAERFLPDHLSGVVGGRIYYSGDKARWRHDGLLEYLGRADEQIKIRGYRIELGEIESVVRDHESVRQAAVIVREELPGGKRLIAYITRKADTRPLKAREIHTFLEERLPAYMMPSAIIELEELPLTSNGKLDRKGLPASEEVRSEGSCPGPGSPEEEILCGIIGEVLNVVRVGVQDNFFELGGHSLLATQVISQIRSLLDVELPLRAIFDAPTVVELAEKVSVARRARQAPPPGLVLVDRPRELPLSFAQQRLWFLDQMEPGTGAYNLPFGLRLLGNLDRLTLERSLNAMIQRHEVLRTRFPVRDGKPVQVIAPEALVQIQDIELGMVAEEKRETELAGLVSEEINRPFDLSRGPLLRVKLFRIAEQEHVLLVTTHHIAGDMWSTAIVVREFGQIYQAIINGEEPSLPALTVQYADFALWQRGWLQGEVMEEQIGYWRKQLKDVPVLELPADSPRPAVIDHRGANVQFELSAELAARFAELCRREGVTLFMGLLGAFQVLLSKCTGQRDVAIGSIIANRNRKEIEGLIGFFANTVVLRTQLGSPMSFRKLLAAVRQTTLEAYEHQNVPFEKLVEELQPDRDVSRTPLFQVMLIHQNVRTGDLRLPGLRLQEFPFPTTTARFDLTLQVAEWSGGIRCTFLYASALYEPHRIERMALHLGRVVETMVNGPESNIGETLLLTETEQSQVLQEWNATKAAFPRRKMHDLFEEQVTKTPEAVAVEYESHCLTYAELNGRANQLAHYLKKLGVGPEVHVGICLDRSLVMLVAMLGTLKAGGTYIPLSPEDPPERRAHVIINASLSVVLTEERLGRTLAGYAGEIVELDTNWKEVAQCSCENVAAGLDEGNLAYLLYTSGSTGQPKGVGVSHGALANFLLSMRHSPGLEPADKLLAVTPISFDIAGLELYLPLIVGACLRLVPRPISMVGDHLANELEKGITVMQATPATWQMLVDSGWQGDPQLRILCGGEALSEALATKLSVKCSTLWNMYGPTETTIWSLAEELNIKNGRINVGKPIANTQAYVLDPEMKPLPIGLGGELYLGGVGLARGYWNRPDLTAERFLPDPFDRAGGGRLYRTGDVVRWRGDGKIEFFGRTDYQVKLRGYRIELGEIEAALDRCDDVVQSVVMVREDRPGEKCLVGYVVRRPGSPALNASDLCRRLAKRLPDYMIPNLVMELKELPLTPNGKVDRKALPAPSGEVRGGNHAKPRSEEEEILCGFFADLLELEQVDVNASFFGLGGHSLLATQLISRIRSVFGVELSVRTLFDMPTVSALARRLRDGKESVKPAATILPADRRGDLPLSFAQQRLWFLYQMEPDSSAYNVPFALRLSGTLDRAALKSSIAAMLARHEILRTVFPARNGRPVQKILLALELNVEERRTLNSGDLAGFEVRQWAMEEADRPFDLEQGPLLRVTLLASGVQEHILLVTMHHIISDGWSFAIMVGEFCHFYTAYLQNMAPDLPELSIQYLDFAIWQRNWLGSGVLEEQLDYWKKHLAGIKPLELPTDVPRSAATSERSGQEVFDLPPELVGKAKKLVRCEGVTLFMLLLAAYQLMLARYTGKRDIVVGTDIANRNRLETEPLIGFFVNQMVLRTDLSGSPSFRELLKRVRRTVLAAYDHQDVPFDKLVEELTPSRDLKATPLFQVKLVLQNMPRQELTLPDLSVTAVETHETRAKFDILLTMAETTEGLRGLYHYNASLFTLNTIRSFQCFYHAVLAVVTEDEEMLDAPEEILLQSIEQRAHILMELSSATPALSMVAKRQPGIVVQR
ncbi:MAG TPA: amino acid adenylation domain-containing protein [Candidatus Angelobacter sp.]